MNLSVKKEFFLIFVLCVVAIALPLVLRYLFVGDYLVGTESYHQLRLAESKIFFYDQFSYGGRYVITELGLPLILSLNSALLSKILPPIIGLLIFTFFYVLIKDLPRNNRIISSVLLIVSPPFIYLSTVLNKYSIAVLIVLLSLLLFKKGKYFASVLLLSVLSLFSVFSAVLFFFLFLIYSRRKKIEKKHILQLLGLDILLLLTQYGYKLYYLGIPKILKFVGLDINVNFLFQNFISDLGGPYGFALFTSILSFIGINYFWRENKRETLFFILVGLVMFILTIFFSQTLFYLNFMVIILASYALVGLTKHVWSSGLIRKMTILVIICGLLFSFVSYEKRLVDSLPNEATEDAVYFLTKIKNNDVVFSHPNKGFWISKAYKKNVMDEEFFYAPNVNERYEDANKLLYTTKLEEASSIINKYNIRYFYMDNNMKDSLYNGREEGLLFLLRYNPNFNLIYKNKEVEIWEIENV